MQGTHCRASRAWALASASKLVVTNMEVAKTTDSFLALYNLWNIRPSYCSYNKQS